ncbi:MAG: replication endonuclease, partial [Bermanella sp.]
AVSTKIRSFSSRERPLENPCRPLIMGSTGFLLPEETQTHQNQPVSNGLNKSPVCHNLGTSRDSILDKHFPIASGLAAEYRRVLTHQNAEAAESRLKEIDLSLTCGDLNLTSDMKEVKKYAEDLAYKVKIYSLQNSPDIAYKLALTLIRSHKFICKDISDQYLILNKARTPKWWFTNLKHYRIRAIEEIARDVGAVNKKKSLYCSEFSNRERIYQDSVNENYLKNTKLKNSSGQELNLAEIASKTVSNPRIRKAELMVRLKGFEEVAEILGDSALFITVTTPSRMHAFNSSGHKNPKYDGTPPKDANKYLCNQWAKVRAEFGKRRIQPYGFRVSEPHHDATPHHHYLLFMKPSEKEFVTSVLQKYAFQDSPNEKGAKEHRFKVEVIDKAKGGATSYIAKYISKSTNGEGLEKDQYKQDSKTSAQSIRTWSGIWRIRQFEQIGGPSVTVWRELRKMDESLGLIVGPALSAADSSNWAAFVLAMGGPTVKRKDLEIYPSYEFLDSVDTETGEILKTRHNCYGEPTRPPVSGIYLKKFNITIPTKNMRWHRTKKLVALEPLERSSSLKGEGCSSGSSVYSSKAKQIFNEFKHGLLHSRNRISEALASPRALAEDIGSSLQCAIRGADAHADLGLV